MSCGERRWNVRREGKMWGEKVECGERWNVGREGGV